MRSDKLEKTKLRCKEYNVRGTKNISGFALAAFLCVLLEVLLRNSILKRFHKDVCQSLFVNRKIRRKCSDLKNLYLYLLLLLPFFLVFPLVFQLQEKKNIRRFGDPVLLAQLMPDVSKYRPDIKFWIIFVCYRLVLLYY